MRVGRQSSDAGYADCRNWKEDLAHEVFGATHTILGYTDLLRREPRPIRERQMLSAVATSAHRITALLNALVVSAQENDGNLESTDLGPLISSVLASHEPTFSELKVALHVDSQASSLALLEPTRLDQIVDLIIFQVLVHLDPGSTVSIRIQQRDDSVDLIFEVPSARPNDITLYLLAQLSDGMGAKVSFVRDLETATFTFRFIRPIREAAPQQTAEIAKTVLHVDDEKAALELVDAVLRSSEIDVVSVTSLKEARQILATALPDVLLLDHRLGDERGLAFLKELREVTDLDSQLQVVLLTAERSSDLIRAVRDLGASILHKPVAPDYLLSTVNRLLQVGGRSGG